MNVNDFANIVKREGRYGTLSSLTDQASLDVLASINLRRKRVWSKSDWPWTMEPLSFAITAATTTYTVRATSGNKIDRIIDLIPRDLTVSPPVSAPPLRQLTRQDFYRWSASLPTDAPDIPSSYVNLGQDANGLWQIELAPSPSSAFTMAGYGKKILTTFTVADLQANTAFDFFPDGIIEDVLLDGCLSDVALIQGDKDLAARLDLSFETKLKMKVGEQNNAGRDDSPITTPAPDSMRFKYRKRSPRSTGVY